MQKLLQNLRRLGSMLGVLIVLVHTLALVGGGINRLTAGPEYNTIDKVVGNMLTATGTIQRWNMFSPNVGDWSTAPVLAVTLKDGGRALVHSPATPRMIYLQDDRFFDAKVADEQLAMDWMVHFGDGRRRKLDSRVHDPVSNGPLLRTTYARWMLQQYMNANPHEADNIVRVDLYLIEIRHVGPSDKPMREPGVSYMFIHPKDDPLWPAGISTSIDVPLP